MLNRFSPVIASIEYVGVRCQMSSRAIQCTLLHHHPTPHTEGLLSTNWGRKSTSEAEVGTTVSIQVK